jgi:hypothetical protein
MFSQKSGLIKTPLVSQEIRLGNKILHLFVDSILHGNEVLNSFSIMQKRNQMASEKLLYFFRISAF